MNGGQIRTNPCTHTHTLKQNRNMNDIRNKTKSKDRAMATLVRDGLAKSIGTAERKTYVYKQSDNLTTQKV